jgi:hypothetical protein
MLLLLLRFLSLGNVLPWAGHSLPQLYCQSPEALKFCCVSIACGAEPALHLGKPNKGQDLMGFFFPREGVGLRWMTHQPLREDRLPVLEGAQRPARAPELQTLIVTSCRPAETKALSTPSKSQR